MMTIKCGGTIDELSLGGVRTTIDSRLGQSWPGEMANQTATTPTEMVIIGH